MSQEHCWAEGKDKNEPCWGKISTSEDYPGVYTFWCEGHGHPEDKQEYKKK